jgi:hypothetical protein
MEIILANKLSELDKSELIKVLTQLMMRDREAFNALKETVEDVL